MFTWGQRSLLVVNVIWVYFTGFTFILHFVASFVKDWDDGVAFLRLQLDLHLKTFWEYRQRMLLIACRSLLTHQQYKWSIIRARWLSFVSLKPLWGDNQTECRQFWLGSIVLLDTISGQSRVGQAILISACIIDLDARLCRKPAVHQEKLKHSIFSLQAISDFLHYSMALLCSWVGKPN
jgi:hypothetical protein